MTDYVLRSDIAGAIDYYIEFDDVDRKFLKQAIVSIPAADVAPVRHARWLTWGEMFDVEVKIPNKDSLGVFCNKCKSHNDAPKNYCPHCGVKMDEEKVKESCEP